MSFLVADALTGRGRVFNLAGVEWVSGELPDGCGLFEASDVTRFAVEHPDAIDVAVLPVRPPLDAVWVESVFARFEHPLADLHGGEMLTYSRFGALVTCGEADDDGHRWVHVDGYGLCGQPPKPGLKLPQEVAPGTVHRMPFEGGYEIDDRGMLVDRGGGVSVAVYPREVAKEPNPESEADRIRVRRTYAEGFDIPVDCPPEERAEADEKIAEIRHLHREIDRRRLELMRLRAKTAGLDAELVGLFDSGWRPTFEVVTTIVVQAVAAMNVRNTVREPMRASRQVRRQRERAGLVDPAEVTVLKVPGAQRVAAGSGAGSGESAKAHHAVLGHFAYYGDTHPDGQPRGLLFGRQEGVFWHPPHWRGNREAGEVRHTYTVVPPES